MESYEELVNILKVILDGGNYGFWKSRMKFLIGGIDVLGQRSILVQWEAPTIVDDDGFRTPKPEETWTEDYGSDGNGDDDLAESYKETELHDERKLSQKSVLLLKEKLNLVVKAVNLEKELHAEKEISAELQSQLDLQYKKIRMFGGTRQLDTIMSYGRTEGGHRGLGYTGRDGSDAKYIKFIAASVSSHSTRKTGGYSKSSTAFRVLNKRSGVIIESVNVVFDDYVRTQQKKDRFVCMDNEPENPKGGSKEE
ncbi:unnamed protein product [Arabis nemorensis]|uniref:Uncharacterized protein n=1 Tax=Arabis nemorensis TaxID=586526 RepID=A0A565AY58_9BRAS|nr:unnamed protein product [Arabis nemorensis]